MDYEEARRLVGETGKLRVKGTNGHWQVPVKVKAVREQFGRWRMIVEGIDGVSYSDFGEKSNEATVEASRVTLDNQALAHPDTVVSTA